MYTTLHKQIYNIVEHRGMNIWLSDQIKEGMTRVCCPESSTDECYVQCPVCTTLHKQIYSFVEHRGTKIWLSDQIKEGITRVCCPVALKSHPNGTWCAVQLQHVVVCLDTSVLVEYKLYEWDPIECKCSTL